MTGRRPFWDKSHDAELIIEIVDGLRPPIVINAPEGYIELMKECWHSDPNKRPSATDILMKIYKIHDNEYKMYDIGPVTINNPGAIYKSRPLSRDGESSKWSDSESTLEPSVGSILSRTERLEPNESAHESRL